MTIQQTFALGFQHHQAGRLAEAEVCYRQVLAVQADHLDALHLLGVVAMETGRAALAVDLLKQVAARLPQHPAVHSNLGEACRRAGRLDDAVASLRRAVQLQPEDVVAQYNLGNALLDDGQIDEAIAAYRRVLALKPDHVDAQSNLGIALARAGSFAEAGEAYRRVLQLAPGHVDAWNNFGIVLAEQGRFAEAVEAYRRALELLPAQPEANNNLGNAYQALGQFEPAVAAYRRALQLKPNDAKTTVNLGNALRQQGRLEEAVMTYRRALVLEPAHAETHNELGTVLREMGQLDEAEAEYRVALELNPQYADAESNLGNVLRNQGRTGEAIAAYRRALELEPEQSTQSNLIYALLFDPECSEAEILREQRLWNERFARGGNRPAPSYSNVPIPDRRLRVGYVSPDFRDHVIGRNVLPLFKEHDRTAFEIFCYSGVVRADGLTSQFRERADHWRSTLGVNDEMLAEMIRRDGVDILVDLTQHMAGNRLMMFAHRPAPVQVSFAGYPESAGLEAIPYRISDRFLEPEKDGVFRIESFWCYDPNGLEVRVNELSALKNGWVTFGCLNQFSKVNEPTLRLWAQVLARVENSRLMVLSAAGSHRQRTLDILQDEGIDPQRVRFAEPRGRAAYLALYHELDVALDTAPYNGHTTSLDALWMGVPVVSLAGEGAVSKAGVSQLTNLGLAELIARSEERYVTIATELAGDLRRLADLRETLRSRMETSVLMDAVRFTRSIEGAYRQMWRSWCAGGRPL